MKITMQRATLATAIGVCLALPVSAENVDPDATGRHYAWAENLGWINAQPSGDGGPGMQVDDFALSGWLWSENAGWISLSCANRGTCGAVPYGVANDGAGNLSGFAWGENVGWVRFAGPLFGVTIDPLTGEFGGTAWSENAGWIAFGADAPVSYGIDTSWRGAVAAELALGFDGSGQLCWPPAAGTTEYEILQSTDPTFAGGCTVATTASTCTTLPDPLPGETLYTLARVLTPVVGTWGKNSNGVDRTPCP